MMAISPTRRSGSSSSVPATETDLRQKSQELGLLGKIFGDREQAPINIAGAIILIGIIGFIIVMFLPGSTDFPKSDMAKSLASLILSAFTFLGGYLGAGRRSKS